MKESNCGFCGINFYKKNINQKYCTNECREKFYEKLKKPIKIEKITCKGCSKVFEKNSNMRNKVFCDSECRNAFYKKGDYHKERSFRKKEENNIGLGEIEIKVMNLINKAKNTQMQTSLGKVFCEFSRSSFTESLKAKVRERDAFRCQICENEDVSLEVHHILKLSLGGSNDMDNLITLCIKCHRAIETGNENHAIKVCTRNANLAKGAYKEGYLTNREKINIMASCLEDIFDSFTGRKDMDDQDIILRIGNVISQVR